MNDLQRLMDDIIDEGYLIGLRRLPDGTVNIIPFEQIGDYEKFYVALVKALIIDGSMRTWIKQLVERLSESLQLAEEALSKPKLN